MNDPRLTAYALGELTGADRDAFERDLASSETLQRELNETIQLAEALGNLPMPTETLPEEKRAALREQCAENLRAQKPASRRYRTGILLGSLAAAAAIVLAFTHSEKPTPASQLPLVVKKAPTPVATPAVAVAQNSTEALLKEGNDFYAKGRYDLAMKRFEKVLEADPQNLTARRAVEQVNESRAKYAQTASNESRSRMLMASTQWEMPVRKFDAGATTITAAPANDEESNARTAAVIGSAKAEDQIASGVMITAPPPAVQLQPTISASAAAMPSSAPAPASPSAGSSMSSDQAAQIKAFNSGWGKHSPRGSDGKRAAAALRPATRADFNTEAYDTTHENTFLTAKENPLSTFSIDVDTASYANVRRFLDSEQVPPAGAIRTEELINYFPYTYPQPTNGGPFSVNLEVSHAPWNGERELIRIGLKGHEVPASERGAANLVFLIDVSGSMDEPDKLPLLQRSLKALVENLAVKDRVAIVVYAGSSGLVLPSTSGTEKPRILEALENLKAGGSTNGADGIRLAYNIARENFVKGGNNRVILCTDGDFNVGTTNQSELVRLIEKERSSSVFLSVLGFGTGNLKDSTMEKLADKGNGNYAYIDSFTEGRKVLVEQMGGTLFTIAKDVKIQVEFNPARVAGYRLIGYENRLLAKEDFNDDKKDAGEIGAGHTVTALYEIVPAGQPLPGQPSVDPLKYQKPEPTPVDAPASNDLLTVKLRYKAPDGDKSQLLEVPLNTTDIPAFSQASSDFQFAAAVAAFGMKLRGSPDAGDIGWTEIQKIARRSLGEDPGSYRAEFLTLIEKASHLKPDGRTPEE